MKIKESVPKLIKGAQEHRSEHPLKKFILVLSFLAIYLFFSVFRYGPLQGSLISFLSWSFFVLCTPIADAGILIDFPLRIFFKIRMVFSEIVVWAVAIAANILTLSINPSFYEKSILLNLLHHILTNPFPLWGIILLSGVGTFLSIHLGDELIDLVSKSRGKSKSYHKKQKIYELISFIFIILFTIVLYYFLLKYFGISKAIL